MEIFDELNLDKSLLQTLKGLKIVKPTLIQAQAIPHILAGEDVIGESATGSGKTLACGCGIIDKVVSKKGLQALVLAPTRELAEQVKDSLIKFSSYKHFNIVPIYGGVSLEPQIHNLRYADVVVATPGRLLDHLERRTVNLSHVKLLILDEADRMLDMGFIVDVEKIIKLCPKDRQTLFFSATISTEIKKLANHYMKSPVSVSAVKLVDPSKLEQVFYDVNKKAKLSLLLHLLKNENSGLVMVFCNTRRITDLVVKNLEINKVNVIAIHGGLSQNKRMKTIKQFNRSTVCVLVCTDIAARGLHIDNVSHVYNYDIPKDAKDYIHRIGRTARAGEKGKVINLLCEFDYENLSRIQTEYRAITIKKLELPEIKKVMMIRDDYNRARGNNSFARKNSFSRKRRPDWV